MIKNPAFVGDGKYLGDGGASLETLYTHYPWKEIRGCPGRYLVRGKVANREAQLLDPSAFVSAAGILGVECVLHRRGHDGADGGHDGDSVDGKHAEEGDDSRASRGGVEKGSGVDDVCVVRFSDGGGVVSFVKTSPLLDAASIKNEEETLTGTSAPRAVGGVGDDNVDATERKRSRTWYVHTLNTRSGLERKLRALGIE